MNENLNVRLKIAKDAARLLIRGNARNLKEAQKTAIKRFGSRRLPAKQRPSREDIQQQINLLLSTSNQQHEKLSLHHLREATTSLEKTLYPQPLFFASDVIDALSQQQCLVEGYRIRCFINTPLNEAEELLCDTEKNRKTNLLPKQDNTPARLVVTINQIEFVIFSRDDAQPEQDDSDLTLAELHHWIVHQEEQNQSPLSRHEKIETPETTIVLEDSLPWLYLERLSDIKRNKIEHPEGDLLYHSLQVFELGFKLKSNDVEFLEACLLHDVGYVVDPKNPRKESGRVVKDHVTDRTFDLITKLDEGHQYLLTGHIAKSIRNSDLFEDLLDLARCDRDGRVQGATVRSLEEVRELLIQILEEWNDDDEK